MKQFDLVIKNKIGEISFNYEELEKELKNELKRYDYEVTEDLIKVAKEDKAHLNKFANAIDKRRKEIKNEYIVPLEAFEENMNALRDLAKEGYKKINDQVNEFEETRKKERELEITEYFISLNFTLLPLNRLFDKKWLNKTCNNWKEQLHSKINQINNDLEIIDSFGLSNDEKLEIKGYYVQCLNLLQAREEFDFQKKNREAIIRRREELTHQGKELPSVAQTPVVQSEENNTKITKKEKILVEFVVEGRDFLDYMNEGIKKYKPQVKIIKREEL